MTGRRILPDTEEIVWKGRSYRRQPDHADRHRRVYFMATTFPRNYLHRDVYVTYNGEIPDGWHVHHIDHDPLNNAPENLAVMSPEAHAALHGSALEPTGRHCDECGEMYQGYRSWGRWCSAACKERRRRRDGVAYKRPRKEAMAEPRICGECSSAFIASRPWSKFCSSKCRGIFGRRMRKLEDA